MSLEDSRPKGPVNGLIICLFILVVLGLAYYMFKLGEVLTEAHDTSIRADVQIVANALELYAQDHDGRFPQPELICDGAQATEISAELVPEYLVEMPATTVYISCIQSTQQVVLGAKLSNGHDFTILIE
jgi:hypothetical protein